MRPLEKLNAFLNGAGFYIVLFLAIAIIGASGYFIYQTLSGNHHTLNTPSVQQELPLDAEHQTPDIERHEDVTLPQTGVRETVPVSGTTQISAEAPQPETPKDTRILAPLQGETVTPFSMDALLYNETMGDWRTHNGVDIAADEGTAVVAAAAGKVTAIVDDYWMGTTVTVACQDGYELTYACLQAGPTVSTGDKVAPGDQIGSVGTTSLLEGSIPPHLHFSVTQNGVTVDPDVYLKKAS